MSLTPGARSTPEETSTPRAPVSAIAAGDGVGVETAGKKPGAARREIPRQAPVEGQTVAAWQRRVFRRLGVDQQQVGNALVGLGGGEVLARRDADRLHRRAGAKLADPLDPRRAFASMQLDEVGRQGVDDALQRVVVGVDGERDDLCASPRLSPEHACGLPVDMARALREKYESDHVRAGVKRGGQRRRGRKTADFDDRRHRAPLSAKTRAGVKGRRDKRNGAPGPRGAARSHCPACRPEARSRSMASISACAAARIFASASR